MSEERPPYISYLVRLWLATNEGEPVWRASAENPHTGERRGFASLGDLFAFLRQQIGVSPVVEGGDQRQPDEINVSEDNQASSPDEKENHTTFPQAETGGRP